MLFSPQASAAQERITAATGESKREIVERALVEMEKRRRGR
jgi:hypothetical protein